MEQNALELCILLPFSLVMLRKDSLLLEYTVMMFRTSLTILSLPM